MLTRKDGFADELLVRQLPQVELPLDSDELHGLLVNPSLLHLVKRVSHEFDLAPHPLAPATPTPLPA